MDVIMFWLIERLLERGTDWCSAFYRAELYNIRKQAGKPLFGDSMFICCGVRVKPWVSDLETDQYIQNHNGERPEPSHWWALHGLDLFQQVPWRLDQTGIWGPGRPSWMELGSGPPQHERTPSGDVLWCLAPRCLAMNPLTPVGFWGGYFIDQTSSGMSHGCSIRLGSGEFRRQLFDRPWGLAITDCHCHDGVYLVCSGVYMGCVCQMASILMQGPMQGGQCA